MHHDSDQSTMVRKWMNTSAFTSITPMIMVKIGMSYSTINLLSIDAFTSAANVMFVRNFEEFTVGVKARVGGSLPSPASFRLHVWNIS